QRPHVGAPSCPANNPPSHNGQCLMKPDMTEAELDARHAEKMKKKKAARDKILATKTIEKGLLIVHTGKGKGKSTAAFGMIFRALGHGMPVAIVQFVKGKWGTGERVALEKFGDL